MLTAMTDSRSAAIEAQPERFRKKPVEIEAWHWTGEEPSPEFLAWIDPASLPSDGVHVGGGIGYTPALGTLDVPTLEGTMTAQPGDWIIRGVAGEFYPCKPEIFDATYERALTAAEPARGHVEPAHEFEPTWCPKCAGIQVAQEEASSPPAEPRPTTRDDATITEVFNAIRYVRRHYDESIFPPPEKGKSRTKDNESAEVARLTCDNIAREIEERIGRPSEGRAASLAAALERVGTLLGTDGIVSVVDVALARSIVRDALAAYTRGDAG